MENDKKEWNFKFVEQKKDITGKKFGRLTCLGFAGHCETSNKLLFIFRCDCGNEIERVDSKVKYNGGARQCGCAQREAVSKVGSSKFINISGQTFGRLTAIRPCEDKSKFVFLCNCVDGEKREKELKSCKVKRGHTTQCGCVARSTSREKMKKIREKYRELNDLSGEEFGNLKVLKTFYKEGFKGGFCKCLCKCGREKVVTRTSLIQSYSLSCGECKLNIDRSNLKEEQRFNIIRNLLRQPVKSAFTRLKRRKNNRSEDIVGCSIIEFEQYIIQLFQEGMSIFDRFKWHIDHIIPVDYAKSDRDLLYLNHYLNLSPMWASDNIQKSNKIPNNVDELFSNLIKAVDLDREKRGICQVDDMFNSSRLKL